MKKSQPKISRKRLVALRRSWPKIGEAAKARRVWHFRCASHPQKKCRSHYGAVAEAGLCAQCRKGVPVNPNQQTIFGAGAR